MECKNCTSPLLDSDKFCSACGAKVITKRTTISSILSEIKENVFSIDANKPLKTFIDLFIKPEEVIDGYINGVRRKYINPFGYFTLAITLSGFFYFIIAKFFPDALSNVYSFMDVPEEQLQFQTKIQKFTIEYQTLLYLVFIPIFAVLTWIIFLNKRKFNFAEHLILNLYGYSQASIFIVTAYFLFIWNETIFKYLMIGGIFLQMLYYAYMLKRLFALSLIQIILKTLLFLLLGFFVYFGVTVVVAILMFITGAININDFAPKKDTAETISYIASSFKNWTS